MDVGRALTAMISMVGFIILIIILLQVVYGSMSVKGEPLTWEQWNGYKAGAAFTAINDAEKNDKTAQEYVERKKRLIARRGPNSPPDQYICSSNLPGFVEDDRVNIITYTPGKACSEDFTGLNLTFISDNGISSLRLDTMPQRLRDRAKEDVN
jgi:hypothetical protein